MPRPPLTPKTVAPKATRYLRNPIGPYDKRKSPSGSYLVDLKASQVCNTSSDNVVPKLVVIPPTKGMLPSTIAAPKLIMMTKIEAKSPKSFKGVKIYN